MKDINYRNGRWEWEPRSSEFLKLLNKHPLSRWPVGSVLKVVLREQGSRDMNTYTLEKKSPRKWVRSDTFGRRTQVSNTAVAAWLVEAALINYVKILWAKGSSPEWAPDPQESEERLTAQSFQSMRWRGPGGGRFQSVVQIGENTFEGAPFQREKVDHYGGGDDDEWDSQAWEWDYARPLHEAVQKAFDATFGKGQVKVTEVGEKGHVYWLIPTTSKRALQEVALKEGLIRLAHQAVPEVRKELLSLLKD